MTLRRRRATDCKPQKPDDQETGREKIFNPMSQATKTQARRRATDCRRRGIGSGVPQRFRAASTLREGLFGESPYSHNVVVEQPAGEPKVKSLVDMSVSSEEESSDPLFLAEKSQRPNTSKPTG